MTLMPGLPKMVVRFAAVAVVAVSASACSSMPDWVNPTNWMGGDDQTASADASQDSGQTQDLASIPNKPVAPSTADEREQVADTLKADRADAQYSADALRGGTEPSAAAPVETPAAATSPSAAPATDADASNASPSSDQAATPTKTATADTTTQSAAPAAATPSTTDTASTSDQNSTTTTPAAPAPQVASAEPTSPAPAAADEQLGFQPSKAPPLDPSVARFVPQTVLDQYQRTTGDTAAAPALTAPAQSKADPDKTSSLAAPPMETHVRRMADSSTVAAAPNASQAPSYNSMVTPASYGGNEQSAPAAVVFFPRDAAVLTAKAKGQVLSAAQSFHTRGGTGFVRVVGHSSSRTPDMPIARHLEVVFEHSQDFATAVAHELVQDGVPADKVLIEAVGDAQPVYYESMPQGEAGNRRAEIFM